MRLLMRLPVWLILLIRLARWNDGFAPIKPILYDPIKELQDEFDQLTTLADTMRGGLWLSDMACGAVRRRINEIAAEIVTLRNLNVAVMGFIPKDMGDIK